MSLSASFPRNISSYNAPMVFSKTIPEMPLSASFLTEKQVAAKTQEFVKTLQQSPLVRKLPSEEQVLDPLKRVLEKITKEDSDTIKEALTKRSGYFARLFSDESWEEWLEPKTSLGKVVHLFAEHAEGNISGASALKRLNSQTIQNANREADFLLKQLKTSTQKHHPSPSPFDCSSGLALGAVGSIATQTPIPIGLAGMNCLKGVKADREAIYQGTITLQPGEEFYVECNRKIAVCKRGITAWNSAATCDWEGPDMEVTVLGGGSRILYYGPLGGSYQWKGSELSIRVKNQGGTASRMYVHAESDSGGNPFGW